MFTGHLFFWVSEVTHNFKISTSLLVFFEHFFKIDAFSAVGKEFSCNAGDPVLIPGLGRSPGEGIGDLFQYSWASLVTQLVKNPPAMWETWVQSLGWEGPLEKGNATPSSILAWRIHGVTKSRPRLSDFHFISHVHVCTCGCVWAYVLTCTHIRMCLPVHVCVFHL